LHRFEDADAGAQAVLAPPYAMDGQRMAVRLPPPHLGQHTDEVLRTVLGMDDTSIEALRSQRAI
jgi:crotonobetainyl-CoA:carnitine CoA-transferase CaiB-like acyl-CoA transferase